MRKVKAIQFVPLGRPPKIGECFRFGQDSQNFFRNYGEHDHAKVSSGEWVHAEAVERREVEVELPDEVPGWIVDLGGPDVPYSLLRDFAAAYRAHVGERAEAVSRRWQSVESCRERETVPDYIARIIREEFLR